jgi:carbon-monoxide dehydrogenase medium subunit
VTPFAWDEPRTLKDAVACLDPDDSSVRPIAGGTALMLMMKTGVFAPSRLVSLARIEPQYSQIRVDASGALKIGAMASLSALEQSADVAKHFPVITRTLLTLSNVRVRNVARVGGALAHGDPHMDLPPLLAALGAKALVVGRSGSREVAVQDLYLGYYETVLAKDELIAEVTVPPLAGARANPCVIVSAATEKVTRLPEAEKVLDGSNGDEKTARRAGDAAVEEVAFLSDAHGSGAYKKELLRVYLARAIRQARGAAAP